MCRRHADGSHRLALIAETESGNSAHYSFDDIDRLSSRLANVLQLAGVHASDRVAVILPQRLETALLHIAAQKLGAISLPLSVLFGADALLYRLADSGARVVVTTNEKADLLTDFSSDLPELRTILSIKEAGPVAASVVDRYVEKTATMGSRSALEPQLQNSELVVVDFWSALRKASADCETANTHSDAAAFLLYTSGTTGPPKGALIPHRALIGNLTGFELSHNGFPQYNDRVYTPADWAWTGGLLDGLLPAWFYGVPVVALDNRKFNPEMIVSLMSRHRVTCTFIPPTALKMMRSVPALLARYPLFLRSVMSAGEAVGEELFAWGQEHLQLDINEMCGQTEHNYLMGNCSAIMPVKPGSMGKAFPGHRVAIMDEHGQLMKSHEVGEIVAHRDDPVHFLGYWNNAIATSKKYTGDWFHTGDVGYIDEDGYLWFKGRADDVISSAGYRIGPGEIEDCVLTHPSVLQVAAIGVPDPAQIRGEIVKLCIVLNQGFSASSDLKEAIRLHVRDKLAAYEYPREIAFYDTLPMTTTGKVKRMELRKMHAELS